MPTFAPNGTSPKALDCLANRLRGNNAKLSGRISCKVILIYKCNVMDMKPRLRKYYPTHDFLADLFVIIQLPSSSRKKPYQGNQTKTSFQELAKSQKGFLSNLSPLVNRLRKRLMSLKSWVRILQIPTFDNNTIRSIENNLKIARNRGPLHIKLAHTHSTSGAGFTNDLMQTQLRFPNF